MLTVEELERYDRQIRLFGVEAQERLKNSRVLVVGLGGLGCPASTYLVAAGVGEVILVDSEEVELSNLNRQVLHWTVDIGRLKVVSASEKLEKLNPNVKIEGVNVRLELEEARKLVSRVDLVLDCLDNWKTRYMLNRVCVELKKPMIHAGIRGLHGQLLTIIPGKTPCLQCLLPKPPREEERFPVLGTTPGILALIQATEAIKILSGFGVPALNKLIYYDGYYMRFYEIGVSRSPTCPTCSSV